MKQLQNKKGFSLIFAMGIVLAISLTTIYLLEYVLPFAKDTKGIEFSTNAYYQSSSAVEEGLLYVANNDLGDEINDPLEAFSNNNTDFGYDIIARGYTIPPAEEGNSPYNSDWNVLAPARPLQIEIGGNTWNNGFLEFQVPKTGTINSSISLETQVGGIITWQINAQNNTLIADEASSRVQSNSLQLGQENTFSISDKYGKTLDGNVQTFENFYDSECNDSNEKCILKLSIINDLVLDNSQRTPVPFIEYKIKDLDNAALRYTRINTEGYSTGFKKEIDIKVPQQTVNEAFDFTIFQ